MAPDRSRGEQFFSSPARLPGLTPDGKTLVLLENYTNIRLVDLSGTRTLVPLLGESFEARLGQISPNGKWIAYESNESGEAFEIYVRPFPNVEEGEWVVSIGGGRQAVWARDGHELFYLALDGSLLTVSVNSRDSGWRAGAPQQFLDNRYFSGGGVPRQYDVAPDGQRVLVLKQGSDQSAPQVRVAQRARATSRRSRPPWALLWPHSMPSAVPRLWLARAGDDQHRRTGGRSSSAA